MALRSFLGFASGLCVVLAGVTVTAPARADISSWIFVGAGPSVLDLSSRETQAALDIATGMGTSPRAPIVVGGIGRAITHFGQGIDLSLSLRGATRGYVTGGLGLALDAGAYQRWWGEGSTGFLGNVSGGLPWGFVLNVSAGVGTNDQKMAMATFGLDFARLTVYRTTGESWWKNPFPAGREE